MFQKRVVWHKPMLTGAKIIVCNHPTTTDPFVMTTITNNQTSILIKDVLFKIPVFGRYLHLAGHIPVAEKNGKTAFETALKHLFRGRSLMVFIEGEITSKNGQLRKPKTGAVRLALMSGLPIVPVGIAIKKVNIKLLTSNVNGEKELGTWYFNGPYEITVGKAYRLKGDVNDHDNVRSLSLDTMRKIKSLMQESSNRITG